MEWIGALQGKTVGLDTAPLIYFIEENPTFLETVQIFFEAMEVSTSIAENAARLRAIHGIRTPDAIQISAALNADATHFLTNDIRLPEIPPHTYFIFGFSRKALKPSRIHKMSEGYL